MNQTSSLTALQKPLQESLIAIRATCIRHRETIAVAESVTAGCLQLLLSTAQQAQDFFQGGMTVYNCAQKAIHLGIEPIFADACNGVDPRIAVAMAQGICASYRAQIGIGITGYATRVPEEGIDECFAYVAIVRQGAVLHQEKLEAAAEGIVAQWDYAVRIIDRLAALLR